MHLNPTFLSNIHTIYGNAGESWLKDLPHLIQDLAIKWHFRFRKPMDDLSYNFVGLVEMKDTSQTAIVKIAPERGALNREIKWLKCMENGVPRVYETDESLTAYLMEHLKPGESLKKLLKQDDDDQATRIICRTMRTLHSRQQDKGNAFPHLSENAKSLSILEGKLDSQLLSKAQRLFQDLTIDRATDVLLHGDLHHANILANEGDWKAIDPHGYIGDPTAEVGAMVRNFTEDLPNPPSLEKIIERRLKIMEEELPFDPQRIKNWAYCITICSLAWSFEDHGLIPEFDLKVATIIDQIKM